MKIRLVSASGLFFLLSADTLSSHEMGFSEGILIEPKEMSMSSMRKVLSNVVEGMAAILVVALAVVVFLQVFNRYVLKAPLAWSEDLAMLLFQWVTFLGAAIAVKRTRHFGIELVVRNLPEKFRRAIEYIVPVFVGIVALIMMTEGIELLSYNRFRIYSSMNLSYTWAYLPIPISGCLMLLYLILQEVTRWQKRREERVER